jgi:hypothetical protein
MWHLLVPGSLPASKVANFFGVSAPSLHLGLHIQLEGQGAASWRAMVERRLTRFRVRMAGRLRARLLGQKVADLVLS